MNTPATPPLVEILGQTDEPLRQILDNTSALVYVKDLKGRYRLVNRYYLEALKLAEEDVVGRTDEEIFPPAIARSYRRNDRSAMECGRAVAFEETALLEDGPHTYSSVKFALRDSRGKANALCGISTDITARKRGEEALRNAALGVSGAHRKDIFKALVGYLANTLEVDFALVSQRSDEARCAMDTLAVYSEGKIVDNFRYSLSGSPCEHVVGREFRYHPRDVRTLFPEDDMAIALDVEGYAGYPLFDSSGKALGLIAVMDRKPLADRNLIESMLKIFAQRAAAELERARSETARQISEASYRAIFEAAEDAIFVHDIDTGAIVDVNPKACATFGYSSEELQRIDVDQLSSGEPPYTRGDALAMITKARQGIPVSFEWHRRNKDGSLHWDEVRLKRIVIAGMDRIVAFIREITERKRAEQALQASEEQYRSIFNASVDGLALWDAEGRIVDVNPAFWRMHGYSRSEFLAIEPYRFIHSESHPLFEQFLRTFATGQPFHTEAKNLRKDGTSLDVEVHGVLTQYRGQTHLLSIVRDITQRKQAEQDRGRLETQLRQAQKMEAIGHLTGGIAHDFNNILSSIMGYIVLAMERQPQLGDEKLANYLERANRSAQRARDLIQQMLTFSRGQRGEARSLSLTPLVKESIKLLGATLPPTVEIRTRLEAELPRVLLDPIQIERVLMNLCINARDAMADEGQITVELHCAQRLHTVCTACQQPVRGDYVELQVRDTGPGIAPTILERMFEPFFSTKPKGEGSGMGLSTVHGIVHDLGGHILVDTEPGAGAAFRILLKSEAPGSAPEKPSVTEGEPQTESGRRLRGHILLVDDDEAVGELMRDLLETWGLQVTTLTSSLEAQTLFVRDPHRFDLVLTDQLMPGVTGLVLAKRFLNIRPELPIVLYTGFSGGDTEQQARTHGIRALLRKPVDFDVLFGIVAEALGGRG